MPQLQDRLRPGGILLIGILLGGTAVVMAPVAARLTGGQPAGAEGVIIKTRTASCPAASFVPSSSLTDFAVMAGEMTGSGEFWCNPALPSKATVTMVVFDVYDGSDSGEIGECGLVGFPIDDAAWPAAFQMAVVGPTGVGATPERAQLSDTSILRNPTNNLIASYGLYCILDGVFGFPDVGLFGASITYKISAGNG